MNNLLSYCGLVHARISASEKDLPVQNLSCLTVYLAGHRPVNVLRLPNRSYC